MYWLVLVTASNIPTSFAGCRHAAFTSLSVQQSSRGLVPPLLDGGGPFRKKIRATITITHTTLHYSRYDSLVAGIAEISLGASLGVLWSEYAILTTACGPSNLSDGLERFCYQVVIVAAGVCLLLRILGKDICSTVSDEVPLENTTLWQVRWAEWLNLLAVVGALVALGSQIYNGTTMDGLSGINTEMCRSMQDFRQLY